MGLFHHSPEAIQPPTEAGPTPEGDKAKFRRMQEELKPLYETARRQRTVVPDALFAQMAAYALEQPHFSDVDAHVDILGIEETLVKARKIFSTPNETVH